MTSFSKSIAHLSSKEKRALLLQLLQQKAQKANGETLSIRELLGIFDSFAVNVTHLDAETHLDPSIRFERVPVVPFNQQDRLLLTGATGFLGAFLLHELLEQTGSQIYCLVRAPNSATGKERILANLRKYGSQHPETPERIIAVPGDLTQPLLGLSHHDFAALADTVDLIYHNGALVNWLYPYARLKLANVFGTQEVIRLAAQGRLKPLHYISSLSVFPVVGNTERITISEKDPVDHGGVLHGGYTQSKWVAEKLVQAASAQGLPATIYRPSLVIGHSQTGVWNTDDVVSRMLKSWTELNLAPDVDVVLDMVPVNYVSRAIVYLSRLANSTGEIYHLSNAQPVAIHDLIAWVNAHGYHVQPAPYRVWYAEMLQRASFSQQTALYSLGPLLALEVSEEVGWTSHIPRFDDRYTQQALNGAVTCPPIDKVTFQNYFAYFTGTGFLPVSTQNGFQTQAYTDKENRG